MALTEEQKHKFKVLKNLCEVLKGELPVVRYYTTGQGMPCANPVDEYLAIMDEYIKLGEKIYEPEQYGG